jgi:hypothetical protein
MSSRLHVGISAGGPGAARRNRQYVVALRWLGWLLERRKGDAELLSRVGYVQLILGDIKAAAVTFQKVMALVAEGGPDVPRASKHLVRRNQGLLKFAEQDYRGSPPCAWKSSPPMDFSCLGTVARLAC